MAKREDVVTQRDRDAIEAMIDTATLHDVLAAVAGICRDKAEHIDHNWQDRNLAALWNRAAGRIERAINDASIVGL